VVQADRLSLENRVMAVSRYLPRRIARTLANLPGSYGTALFVDGVVAIVGPSNSVGSSSVPTFRTTRGEQPAARFTICVPQSAQNSRVTGRSRSLRGRNFFGLPVGYLEPWSGIKHQTCWSVPPELYWHSAAWHAPFIIHSARPAT